MADTLKPSVSLLVKLGSIVVHAEEYFSLGGHPYDKTALDGLLTDPEVREWRNQMDAMAFLPKKRS